MLKNYKKQIIITSIVILLPIIIGLILWDQLPDTIATHFDANNEPNGWSSKPFAVFGMPVFLLAMHLICIFATAADPKMKEKGIQSKIFNMILWIIPLISVLMLSMTYIYSMGVAVDVGTIVICFMSVVFIIIGNYLPKCQQSYTIGIKIPWTLESEENWHKTHRFAGFLWMVCGAVCLLCAFIRIYWILIVVFAVMVLLPMIYSYCIYRKEKAE